MRTETTPRLNLVFASDFNNGGYQFDCIYCDVSQIFFLGEERMFLLFLLIYLMVSRVVPNAIQEPTGDPKIALNNTNPTDFDDYDDFLI